MLHAATARLPFLRHSRIPLRSPTPLHAIPDLSEGLEGKQVLVLGGTGRVGSSAAAALLTDVKGIKVVVASRSEETYKNSVARRPMLKQADFLKLDCTDRAAVKGALEGVDLVIHAAGPFQGTDACPVLDAAIEAGTNYMDVCDDPDYALRAKSLHEKAKGAGVAAITTAGIYPGMSNLMAAHIVSSAKGEYTEDGFHRDPEPGSLEAQRLRYSYYTAGSGGVGPTLITTTFMLLGEPVVAFKDGEKYELEPLSQGTVVDFGPGVGRKSVSLLHLPEVVTAHDSLGIPSVSARFGTSPDIFNVLMWLMARLIPKSKLQDRQFAELLAKFSAPFIQAADTIVGETVAMRVDLEFDQGKTSSGIYIHSRMSEGIGTCVSAFARCILAGGTTPGVWYPEEKQAVSHRKSVLSLASKGCTRLLLNKSAWTIETEPVQLGMGFYY